MRSAVSSEIIAVPADPTGFGQAAALRDCRRARGAYVITVDPDFSGPMTFLADLVGAARTTRRWSWRRVTSTAAASTCRRRARAGSRVLNAVFRRGLSLGVNDGSSAIRLYRTDVVNALRLEATDYDILQEVLVRAYADGWRVLEIPLHYRPNPAVASKAHASLAFGVPPHVLDAVEAAQFDRRGRLRLPRARQSRSRCSATGSAAATATSRSSSPARARCSTSAADRAISSARCPAGSVALDVLANKLRFARRFRTPRVRGSGFALPFADESFPCVLCSQVIEHVPMVPSMIDELCRVLAPGGRLVLGTPDYDRWEWVWIEKAYGVAAPGGYADEHISHYTRKGLLEDFARRGYTHEATRYILRGELILAFRKPAR